MTVADRLRRLLESRGFTIAEVAKLSGMSRQQAHRIVSGENDNPGVKVLGKLVESMGATLGELFADPE
jgi:transcriptional regulator with XRE-family HTH domain